MAAVERVFALHDFDAENPDEVSFKAGEAVVVVEKDDAYGDGWWQGTNIKGETGLFPFSYTTYDVEAAKGSAAAQRSSDEATSGKGPNGKVMNTTMADIDEALAGLRTGNGGNSTGGVGKAIAADRRSMNSEKTGDFSVGDTDENGGDAEDDLEARAKARAALAVNAARNQEEVDEIERAEQVRMKAQAQKIFEEEEEKQRRLLLKKEEERKVAAAQGTLKEPERAKVAPIAGLDMSDDSDSEGSEGPDYDDGMVAPTHAPLFGGMAASPPNSSSFNNTQNFRGMATGSDSTSKDPTFGVFDRQQQQGAGRNLSPIPSSVGGESPNQNSVNQTTMLGGGVAAASGLAAGAYAAASRSASSNQKGAVATSTDDQRSLSSSMGRGSTTADSPAPASSAAFTSPAANGTSGGTASTSMIGTETPKSQFTAAQQQSPSSSVAGSRQQHHTSPGGDPRDWTVDQVVEWGRSKGWDEAQVVSKFAEHEISGDVLLEMDINILKEIDIQAFGKRFQVSTAIKELNKSLHGPATATANPVEATSAAWPATPDGGAAAMTSATPPPPASFTPQHPHQVMQQLQPPMPMQSQSQQQQQFQQQMPRDFSPQAQSPRLQQGQLFNVPGRASSSGVPGGMPGQNQSVTPSSTSQYFDVPVAENDAAWTRSPKMTSGDGRASQDRNMNSRYNEESMKADSSHASLRTGSDEPPIVNSAPMVGGVGGRKRESAGSASGKTSTDRSSFFAGFSSQKVRKPAPRVLSQAPSEADGKGTFSRLGFNRHKQGNGSNEASTPVSDLRNKISLPTSSPTYDAFGDTARRNRASQLSSGSGGLIGNGAGANRSATGGYGAGGAASGAGHQKQQSVGSAGPNAADWHTPQSPNSNQRGADGAVEGPVMLRIRPVDREGWMRKKGERYNSWKPRYLALKGSDLVLLREPSAAKIKGYVSMKGYKVIADENTNPGKYGFKILHETEKPHYFSSDDAIVVREWMKALMKATIDRDTSLPVISSYNNATISLKEAQRMNPPPRPPSPTSRARAQRATARANKDQLTAKDASVLMGLHQSNDTRQKGL